jgi:hypothetical protein
MPRKGGSLFMKEVEIALSRIETVSNTLNQTSDLLSQKIVEIESALNHYKLGIWAWLEEPLSYRLESDGNGVEVEVSCHFGYGKIRDKWGLLVQERLDYDPEVRAPLFLKDAPRDIRARAVERIPELLKCVTEKAADLSREIAKKTQLAEQIAASLKKAK